MSRITVVSDKATPPVVGTATSPMSLDIDLAKIKTLSDFDVHMRILRQEAAEAGLK